MFIVSLPKPGSSFFESFLVLRGKRKVWLLAVVAAGCILPAIAAESAVDTDADGLADDLERQYYTDLFNPDTDGDGYADGVEVKNGYSPHQASSTRLHQSDYDQDGLNDWLEGWFGSDRGKADSDGDGYKDFEEVMHGYDPVDIEPRRKFERRIVVDRATQRLYYFVDKVKVLNLPVSTGNYYSETPAGIFSIERLISNKRYRGPGYDLAGVKWNLQFKPGYYIHGAYWHNDFGRRTHSHGCVNMRNEDAAFLYKYMSVGVPVEIVGKTPGKFLVGT